MYQFINLNQLTPLQLNQYRKALSSAFPQIIRESAIIKNYWGRLEAYFPEFQFFLISANGDLVGFMNTIPFQFKKDLKELPESGWDWMFEKGISDFEKKEPTNFLGGLQVIVRNKYQKLGYSKEILDYSKQVLKSSKFLNLVIPIRPTKKHIFPTMSMETYLGLKDQNAMYDPWVRTHLNGGAQIIKVCNHSMSMKGDIRFWENILNKKIVKSGEYLLEGALKPVTMDVENDSGEYKEPNIWIKYEQ